MADSQRPEASVVMSVYNGAAHLRASIESILSQEGVDLEFVIVNDGSTDDAPRILEEYAARDPRIRLIHQENQGLTHALIRGCSEARGEFIARHDNGDISLPGRLAAQAALLRERPDMVLAVSWVRQVLEDGQVISEICQHEDSEELTRCWREEMVGIPAHGCTMFRRDAYVRAGGYRAEFYYAQDCDLWLRLAPLGALGCVREVLYELAFNIHGISSSRTSLQRAFALLGQQSYRARQKGDNDDSFVTQAGELRKKALAENRKGPDSYELAGSYYRLGAVLEQQGRSDSRRYYRLAFATCPYYWRTWRKLF